MAENQQVRGPTAALFENPFASSYLKYPNDLESATRAHIVQFTINVPQNTSYGYSVVSSKGPKYLFDDGKGGADTSAAAAGFGTAGVIAAANSKDPSLGGALAAGVGGAAAGSLLSSADALKIAPATNQIAGAISLYMPDTVNMSFETSYQEDNLSDYKVPYYGSLGESLIQSILSGSPQAATGSNMVSGTAQILAGLKDLIKSDFVPINALLKGQGVAINPQVQLLFKAVGLRQFQMEFMFSPKSADESAAIRNIVQKFKFHAAPEIAGNAAGAKSGLFFVVPSTFNIDFLFSGTNNQYLHRIGECVLETVTVDYAPNGWASFKDGSPTQVRLNLTFKEVDIVDKSKVSEGY